MASALDACVELLRSPGFALNLCWDTFVTPSFQQRNGWVVYGLKPRGQVGAASKRVDEFLPGARVVII